jgi:hypothetical protein
VKPPAVLVFKGLGDDADVPVLLPGKVTERERARAREREREREREVMMLTSLFCCLER